MYPGYKLTDDLKIIGKKGTPLTVFETQAGHQFVNVYVKPKTGLLYLDKAIVLVFGYNQIPKTTICKKYILRKLARLNWKIAIIEEHLKEMKLHKELLEQIQ